MLEKYNVKLCDWEDFEGTKGKLMYKMSYRNDNDTLIGYDNESVATLFAKLATNYDGNKISIRGISDENDTISLNPFIFIMSEKESKI